MSARRLTRRYFLAATGTTLVAAGLAACGATPAPVATTAPATEATPAPAAEPAATTAPAAASGEKKVLRFSTYTFSAFEDAMKEMFAIWEEQNPGATVQGEFSSWDDYWTKLQTLVAAGSAPDVGIASCIYPVTYARKGVVLPLDEFIARDSYDLSRFIPAALDQYKWIEGNFDVGGEAGKVYALPGDAQPYIFVYNKNMFDDAGVAYPTDDWTWDDVVTAGRAITNADADKYGCGMPPLYSLYNEGEWTYSAGGSVISADLKTSGLDTPETMSAFQWVYDLVYTHRIAPQPTPSEATNPFASGRVAMVWEGIWVLVDYAQITDFEWDMAMHPKNLDTGKRTMSLQSDGWWAFKGAADPELAWSFLQYLVSDEGQQKFADMDYFIPPSIPSVAEAWYAKKPPENRGKALDALLADSKKYGATYYESSSIAGAFAPELDKAYVDGEPLEPHIKVAAQIMNEELTKAWEKFQA